MACLLEFIIEYALHLFPNRIAIRLDHHAAADGRLLGKVSLDDKIIIPLRVVLGPFSYFFCHIVELVFCYIFTIIVQDSPEEWILLIGTRVRPDSTSVHNPVANLTNKFQL